MIPQLGLAGLTLAAQIGSFATGASAPLVTTTVPMEGPKVEIAKKELPELIVDSAKLYEIDPEIAVAIARCESRIRQYDATGQVLRGELTPADVGIFQINEKYHLERSRGLGYDIYTSEGNIGYAMWLLKKEGQKHWKASSKCWAGA